MYHGRFKKTHYEAGYRFGELLKTKSKKLNACPTFPIDQERIKFGQECMEVYKKYYPVIVEEVRGIADGNETDFSFLATLIFTMYCYDVHNRCSCFACKSGDNIIFGRNSDFLVSIEKLYMNVLYDLDNSYSFNGNTTSFVEIEDGVNEYGLAIGLTFIPVEKIKPGFNIGILVRYLLEKCQNVEEAIKEVNRLPIASGGTLTMIDKTGNMVVVELSSEKINIIRPSDNYVCATNIFVSDEMKEYNLVGFDNWRAEERYQTLNQALSKGEYSVHFAKDLLSGKYGFMCQYDRRANADTVWSVVYDIHQNQIFRVEGNPGRKKFKIDSRWQLK